MGAKTFEISVEGERSPQEILRRAKEAAENVGIVIHGDEAGGSFRGTADGTYAVEGQLVQVEVTNKPALVPWMMVESTLKQVFG